MAKGTLKIHSENILPIIKKWLYTEKEIFVRELVSNACDALSKLEKLKQLGDFSGELSPKIEILIDKEKKTLTFADNGLGMTAEEIEKYIAQIAFSGAEEFVQKYQSNKEQDQIIGHFGLGFYSAYMVAKHIEIDSLSYQEGAKAALWSCDGSSEYELTLGKREERGTTITLFLSDEEAEYLEPTKLRQILKHYCAYLPHPITLNGDQINEKPPIWVQTPTETTDKEALDFYRSLFPMQPDPLFWIHLNVDYPFHLKGILYFPKLKGEMEIKKESIKLFCNRVFVSDNCKDLLPDYLTILQGCLDSPDIPLNVSRSTLQMDKTVRQLGAHLSKKISDKLNALYRHENEKFLSYWDDIEPIVKFGALQDEKFFERCKPFLGFKTVDGAFTPLSEALENSSEKTLYYTTEDQLHAPILNLFKEKNVAVFVTKENMLDQALLSFLERKLTIKFQRVDGGLADSLLDPSKEKTLLDAAGKTERSALADFVKAKLNIENLEVEAKSLDSKTLPALLLVKEEERRLRDQLAYRNEKMGHALVKPTFVVNTNSDLVNAIYKLKEKSPTLAKKMLHSVYDLTCLSQKELPPENLNDFVSRSTSVLEELAAIASNQE